MKGDVMVTYQVVSKLQCEDLCMRTPQCQGFNYGEQKCDILSKIYDPHEREKCQHTSRNEKGNNSFSH